MTSINLGNQTVYDKYRQPLTGDLVGKARQVVRQPGILTGMIATKNSVTVVRIAPGRFNISDGTRTVTIETTSNIDITVTPTNQYVVARYSYSETEAWYAEFLSVGTLLTNDVVIAEVSYTGSDIDQVDISNRTNAKETLDDDVFVTALGKNDSLKSLIESGNLTSGEAGSTLTSYISTFWLDEVNTPEEIIIDDSLYGVAFNDSASKYLYFYTRTGASVDTFFKITYFTDVSVVGVVRLKLSIIPLSTGLDITNIKSDFSSAVSTEENIVMPSTLNEVKEATTTQLKIPQSLQPQEYRHMFCRLERDYSNASDTHTGKFILLGLVPF